MTLTIGYFVIGVILLTWGLVGLITKNPKLFRGLVWRAEVNEDAYMRYMRNLAMFFGLSFFAVGLISLFIHVPSGLIWVVILVYALLNVYGEIKHRVR